MNRPSIAYGLSLLITCVGVNLIACGGKDGEASAPAPLTTLAPAPKPSSAVKSATSSKPLSEVAIADRRGLNGYDYNTLTMLLNTVRLVPGGEYEVGTSNPDFPDRFPRHKVKVADFWILNAPITVEVVNLFTDEVAGYKTREFWTDEGWAWKNDNNISQPLDWVEQKAHPKWPATGISYYEAEAIAKSMGVRLCTETEWEIAAGGGKYVYPWGDTFARKYAAWNPKGKVDVGLYPIGMSPFGIMDCVGNVLQITASSYTLYPGNDTGWTSPFLNTGRIVLRGSSHEMVDYAATVSYRTHWKKDFRDPRVGTRLCASDGKFLQEKWTDISLDLPQFRPGEARSSAAQEREKVNDPTP